MSLWTVSDTQTAEFMAMFYEAWLARQSDHAFETAGKSLRRALRDTRLKAKEREGYSERHWAAFVLGEN
ncbi:MAG: CHAT domain-containing protein [Geminicoccaceae bacterium]